MIDIFFILFEIMCLVCEVFIVIFGFIVGMFVVVFFGMVVLILMLVIIVDFGGI